MPEGSRAARVRAARQMAGGLAGTGAVLGLLTALGLSVLESAGVLPVTDATADPLALLVLRTAGFVLVGLLVGAYTGAVAGGAVASAPTRRRAGRAAALSVVASALVLLTGTSLWHHDEGGTHLGALDAQALAYNAVLTLPANAVLLLVARALAREIHR